MVSPQTTQPQQLWNKLPPEILGLILSNLGKHELLNSRMVSHAWNDESLKVLEKSKFTQMLTESNIKDYILFATSTDPQPHPFIIPFHLDFNIHSLHSCENDSNNEYWGPLNTLMSHVESLCHIFGPECVSALTLSYQDTVRFQKIRSELGLILTQFLAFVSPGLETLDLTRFRFRIPFEQNQDEDITFPNLQKMICDTRECHSDTSGPGIPYSSILKNSPNLDDLTLTHGCMDMESWLINFNQLKSLSHVSFYRLQNLLDIILTSSPPPVLRELNFINDVLGETAQGYEDIMIVYNILESLSPTLKSLKFHGDWYSEYPDIPRIMRFPKLPHLEHLGLEYDVGPRCLLTPGDMNLSQETFPSLKSIEIPIGLIVPPSSSPHQLSQQEDADVDRIEFPNMTKLILRVSDGDTTGPEELNGILEHLQRIFPTPSKLSLVNDGGHDCVKYLLDRIIKSNWSKNIQEIEMIGFNYDYLGQTLDGLEFSPEVVLKKCNGVLEEALKTEFQNTMWKMRMACEETASTPGDITILTRANLSDSFKMTNVTSINLELNKDVSHCDLSSRAPFPNLIAFGKHFPQLQRIAVSELLFHETDKTVQGKHILEFKSKFPGLGISLT